MKKSIAILIILLSITSIWGINNSIKLKSFDKSISYYHSNLYEVLTTYEIENVGDINEVFEFSTKLRLIIVFQNISNYNKNTTYILRTLDHFNRYFHNELTNEISKQIPNLDSSRKQLSILQEILVWYNTENQKDLNTDTFKGYLRTLDLDDETIEKIAH